MSRLVALLIAGVTTFLGFQSDPDRGVALALANAVCLSMIFRPGWWLFWMPFGFWEQRASDSGRADQQGPAIVFLGWIALLLVGLLNLL